jgi:hypothetical protein
VRSLSLGTCLSKEEEEWYYLAISLRGGTVAQTSSLEYHALGATGCAAGIPREIISHLCEQKGGEEGTRTREAKGLRDDLAREPATHERKGRGGLHTRGSVFDGLQKRSVFIKTSSLRTGTA